VREHIVYCEDCMCVRGGGDGVVFDKDLRVAYCFRLCVRRHGEVCKLCWLLRSMVAAQEVYVVVVHFPVPKG
jgi:hypothetical protein